VTFIWKAVRGELAPLLIIGLVNVLIWYLILIPQAESRLGIGAVAGTAIVGGVFTPTQRGMPWFAALCLMIPALFIPNREHGALIVSLLFGFLFPPVWLNFLMTFTPDYLACAAFVWLGFLIRRAAEAIHRRAHLRIDAVVKSE
jgi:hypothetical protein